MGAHIFIILHSADTLTCLKPVLLLLIFQYFWKQFFSWLRVLYKQGCVKPSTKILFSEKIVNFVFLRKTKKLFFHCHGFKVLVLRPVRLGRFCCLSLLQCMLFLSILIILENTQQGKWAGAKTTPAYLIRHSSISLSKFG